MSTGVEKALSEARKKGIFLVTAESLTAGLIASSFAEIPGASDVLVAGFVVYTQQAKTKVLSVGKMLIERFGVVSEPVAKSMASGALLRGAEITGSENCVALAVTGIAGPGGGTETVPVGTVCFAISRFLREKIIYTESETFYFTGDRNEIRKKTTEHAIASFLNVLNTDF
jgi:competence/damage-inducible protein cinA C-terminal domain